MKASSESGYADFDFENALFRIAAHKNGVARKFPECKLGLRKSRQQDLTTKQACLHGRANGPLPLPRSSAFDTSLTGTGKAQRTPPAANYGSKIASQLMPAAKSTTSALSEATRSRTKLGLPCSAIQPGQECDYG